MEDIRIMKTETTHDENDGKYWTLFSSVDEGFCIIEMCYDSRHNPVDYRFLEVNPAFARQTGLLHAEGKSMRMLAPELEDYWYQIFGRIALTGKPERFVNEAKVLNRWYDVYAFRVGVPEKRQLAVIFRDITERTNIEIEQRRRIIELESVNKELESFSRSVSHDLQAPLRCMDEFSLALLEDYGDALDSQATEYLQYIRSSSQQMSQLIDDILNLSRVNRIVIHLDKIDLSGLAYEVAEELKRNQPERKIDFLIEPNLEVVGDRKLMKLVMQNLLGNSCKFTGKQDQAIIEFGRINEYDEDFYFVRDNGVGFDMSYDNKLFKPFQKLHRPDAYPGSGVGLATVQRIINRLGGRVWAEGNPGQGATFCFTLLKNKHT